MEVQLIERNVKVSKETLEIGEGVKKVIESYKKAVADGWQPGQDIPAILMASYQDLLTAIDGADKVGGEFKGEPIKAAMGALIPLAEGVEMLMEKDEQPSA